MDIKKKLHIMHENQYCLCIKISFDIINDVGNIRGTWKVLMDKYYKLLSSF